MSEDKGCMAYPPITKSVSQRLYEMAEDLEKEQMENEKLHNEIHALQAKLDELTGYCESETRWATQYMKERDALQTDVYKLDAVIEVLRKEMVEDDETIVALQRKLEIAKEALHSYGDAFLDITGAVARIALKQLEEE